jgi:hypothetical protein
MQEQQNLSSAQRRLMFDARGASREVEPQNVQRRSQQQRAQGTNGGKISLLTPELMQTCRLQNYGIRWDYQSAAISPREHPVGEKALRPLAELRHREDAEAGAH